MGTTPTTSTSNRAKEFSLAIRIRHPAIDPAEITSVLGREPDYCYKVGESRKTPKGNELEGKNKESFWYCDVEVGNSENLVTIIKSTNQMFIGHERFIAKLLQSGGVVEYFIGVFVDNNTGFTLERDLLEECANLNINLAFDIYEHSDIR